ncbi:MAG: phage tail protein [Bacteroidales bacterium]|jgi:phage tail-like protein|nr:phage tail protein [Bacteroidales bacterium]
MANLFSPYYDDANFLPVSFYFSVLFVELLEEVAFKEVSGLNSEMEVETIKEGGLNDYEHKLPKQIKHSNLILKRASMPLTSAVQIWIKTCLESDFSQPFFRVCMQISLLNEYGIPARNWLCANALPVKWELGSFDSQKNEIMIETLEFAYQSLTRIL